MKIGEQVCWKQTSRHSFRDLNIHSQKCRYICSHYVEIDMHVRVSIAYKIAKMRPNDSSGTSVPCGFQAILPHLKHSLWLRGNLNPSEFHEGNPVHLMFAGLLGASILSVRFRVSPISLKKGFTWFNNLFNCELSAGWWLSSLPIFRKL